MTTQAQARRRQRSAFAQEVEKLKKPPHVVELPVEAFADGRPQKPVKPVKIGLRLLPEQALTRARAAAGQEAWRLHPHETDERDRVDAFNSHLIGILMAASACSPEDVNEPFFQPAGESKIFLDLTSDGIRRLWDEYEVMVVMTSPTSPEPSEAELEALVDAILSGQIFSEMDVEQGRRVRRMLKAAIDAGGILPEPMMASVMTTDVSHMPHGQTASEAPLDSSTAQGAHQVQSAG